MAVAAIYVGAALWSAYSSYRQGQEAKKAGVQGQQASKSQARLLDYNAAVADLQAQDALERGAEEESHFRTQIRATVGSLRTGFAASDIQVGYGSAVDTQADAAYLGELDAQTIRTNATRAAWGFKVNAEDLRQRAHITRKEGINLLAAGNAQATAANVNAVGSLIGGATSVMQQRYAMNRAKA